MIFNRDNVNKDTINIEILNFEETGDDIHMASGYVSVTPILVLEKSVTKYCDIYYEGN